MEKSALEELEELEQVTSVFTVWEALFEVFSSCVVVVTTAVLKMLVLQETALTVWSVRVKLRV